MRKFNIIISFILVLLLVACNNTVETFTVTFDSMGGSDVAAVTVDGSTTLDAFPDAPTKEGYRFVHWYDNKELFAFDITKAVTADITLKAYYVETVTISFVTGEGASVVDDVVIDKGTVLETIPAPTKDDNVFEYWYLTNDYDDFDFSVAIDSDLVLTAQFELETLAKIDLDIEYFEANMVVSENLLYLPVKGEHYDSIIKYEIDSQYISKNGVILSLLYGETAVEEEIIVTFKLDGEQVEKTYDVQLSPIGDVVLVDQTTIDFVDLSTEYDVANGSLDLYFEDGGSVPYVKITDFFNLLEGFIDPELDMTIVETPTTLTMSYQYYDEDEDITYDLELVVDSETNTFTTNDSGFYWAYVYSTATNYGRNIEYLLDHPDNYSSDYADVVYDLTQYNMDVLSMDGEMVVPFYVANQLFVGPSYYNVYYNVDKLYGIYLLPDSSSKEYKTIHSSTVTGEDIPYDLLEHTFNMLAFDLDYLYGLKDIMGVDTYYDLLFEMKNDILTVDANDLDQGISTILLKEMDEPHTSYGYMSYYSEEEPSTSSLSDYGSRFSSWYLGGLDAVNEVIGSRFGTASSGWNAVNGFKPDYWLLDETTAMLTLNDFNTADLYEGDTYDESYVSTILGVEITDFDLPDIVGGYYYFYNSSTLKDDLLEILVKDVDPSYVATYTQTLVDDGYTNVIDTSNDNYKENGYYTKDITLTDETVVTMFVLVTYDEEYDLLYVGVAEKAPLTYTTVWPLTSDVSALVIGDSAVYMEETLENIMEEQPTTTTVILDLSWNTGGNVGALYRVLGYITDQPFTVSGMNRGSDSEYTSVVGITKANDYNTLNWALLTTKVTFSAANSMTKIFIENDLGPTIGVQTGGGACSITPILLPNGTAFTTSSNSISAIRTGSGTELDPYVYTDVEFGVVPEFVIDLTDIYSNTVLLSILAD